MKSPTALGKIVSRPPVAQFGPFSRKPRAVIIGLLAQIEARFRPIWTRKRAKLNALKLCRLSSTKFQSFELGGQSAEWLSSQLARVGLICSMMIDSFHLLRRSSCNAPLAASDRASGNQLQTWRTQNSPWPPLFWPAEEAGVELFQLLRYDWP